MIKRILTVTTFLFTTLFFAEGAVPVSLSTPTTSDGFSVMMLFRGILGMAIIIGIAWLLSSNRKTISWKLVLYGLGTQILLAVSLLYIPFVQQIFEFVGKGFVKILSFTQAGTEFLFKSFSAGAIESPLMTFAITILPTIIFFSALTSVLFYFGIIQKVVKLLAWVLTRLLKIGGAESLSVAGNIFLGQTESPLLIKGYLDKMNRSEMLLVMAGGMATLAGGVLAVYIKVLGGAYRRHFGIAHECHNCWDALAIINKGLK